MAVYHGTVVLRVQKKSSLALRRADRLGSVGRKQYNIGGARLVGKISYLLGGQINDPSSGRDNSLTFVPTTPLSPSRTLEGLLELT